MVAWLALALSCLALLLLLVLLGTLLAVARKAQPYLAMLAPPKPKP